MDFLSYRKIRQAFGSIWETHSVEKSVSGRFTKLTGLLLALSLLVGCSYTPYRIDFGVINNYPSAQEGANTYCTDGLEASLSLQDVKVESGLIASGKSGGAMLIVPEGANPGTLLTTEARCYREGEEVGYAFVEKSYRSPRIPIVDVFPPPAEGPSEITNCVEPTEARGVPICIKGDPYS